MLGSSEAFQGFAVPDVAAAEKFYGETLGLNVEMQEQMGLTLHLGGGRDVFIYPKPDFQPATYTILNFPVPDIDAAVDGLTERGLKFERYDGFEQDEKGIARPETPEQGPQIAWFKDPAGNIMSVLQQ
ncbi:MAG: hypothetical protein QOG54_1321 [Actinomycetota bacterium]|nr:hypothetical protein [Actinomycetota bacterium]